MKGNSPKCSAVPPLNWLEHCVSDLEKNEGTKKVEPDKAGLLTAPEFRPGAVSFLHHTDERIRGGLGDLLALFLLSDVQPQGRGQYAEPAAHLPAGSHLKSPGCQHGHHPFGVLSE